MTSQMAYLGAFLRDRPSSPVGTRSATQHVPSTPSTVVWGHIPLVRAPVASLRPGELFSIDTVSHRGLIEGIDPVSFFAAFGIPSSHLLPDALTIYAEVVRPPGADGHVITGPVAIRGAKPGDALEVVFHDASIRVTHGVNASRPGQGLLPDLLREQSLRVLQTTPDGTRVTIAPGITVPVAPFPGFIGTGPAASTGTTGTRVPSNWGGNLDLRWLRPGASILLPVARPEAMLYIGDPHSAQGHGEVNGTAVEHSASFLIEARIIERAAPDAPIVLTSEAVTCLGIASDPKEALRSALRNAIELIGGWTDGRLDTADAYALCSIAADVGLAEVVNGADVAYVSIPRDVLPSAR